MKKATLLLVPVLIVTACSTARTPQEKLTVTGVKTKGISL